MCITLTHLYSTQTWIILAYLWLIFMILTDCFYTYICWQDRFTWKNIEVWVQSHQRLYPIKSTHPNFPQNVKVHHLFFPPKLLPWMCPGIEFQMQLEAPSRKFQHAMHRRQLLGRQLPPFAALTTEQGHQQLQLCTEFLWRKRKETRKVPPKRGSVPECLGTGSLNGVLDSYGFRGILLPTNFSKDGTWNSLVILGW